MVTGVLAGLAGFLTVRGANLSNQAIYNSNQAVLHQAQASDHWSEYQADSLKRHMDENVLRQGLPNPHTTEEVTAEIAQMKIRQADLKQLAQQQETLREGELTNGAKKLATKDLLDYAGVAAQLGIALASVAALTKRFAAFGIGLIAGALGVAITAYAIGSPYVVHFFSHH